MAPLTFEQSMSKFLAEQQKERDEQKAQFKKGQDELKEQIELLTEKIDKLTLLYTDLQEKYVHQNNQLREELSKRR